MKTEDNLAPETVFDSEEKRFDSYITEGVNMEKKRELKRLQEAQANEMKSTKVRPIQLRNFVTGKRQNVITGMTSYQIERAVNVMDKARSGPIALRVDDFPMEFKTDVRRALQQFSVTQRRVLFNFLVRHMSIDSTIRGTRKTRSHWERWLTVFAIPMLKESLKDYSKDGKLVLS